jgi:hypothetical protein
MLLAPKDFVLLFLRSAVSAQVCFTVTFALAVTLVHANRRNVDDIKI